MKKKGFTLIELLAVIVILAVILTIAVPAVKKTVDSAKKKTAENDALMIKGIAEKYYTANLKSDEELTGVDLTSDTLSYSGEKPSKGYLFFTEDGIAYGKMYLNGYCIEITSSGESTSTKVGESECDIPSEPEIVKEEIIISTSEDLLALKNTLSTKDTKTIIIKLENDIDMSGYEPIGTSSKPFYGVFDGQNHTITNAIIKGSEYSGLIGYLATGGEVKNVIMINSTITGTNYVGAIVGYNKGTIDNVQVESTPVTGTKYVGGIVGYGGKILNSGVRFGLITGDSYVGGLAGDNATIDSCSSDENTISANSNYGNVVGKTGVLTNVTVNGETVSTNN